MQTLMQGVVIGRGGWVTIDDNLAKNYPKPEYKTCYFHQQWYRSFDAKRL